MNIRFFRSLYSQRRCTLFWIFINAGRHFTFNSQPFLKEFCYQLLPLMRRLTSIGFLKTMICKTSDIFNIVENTLQSSGQLSYIKKSLFFHDCKSPANCSLCFYMLFQTHFVKCTEFVFCKMQNYAIIMQ